MNGLLSIDWASVLDELDVESGSEIVIDRVLSGNGAIMALKAIQAIKRDADFTPIAGNHTASELRQADSALLVLSHLFTVAERRLNDNGWDIIGEGETAGSVVYEHRVTGEKTEEPVLAEGGWQQCLMQQLPILFTPALIGNKIVWAVEVVAFDSDVTVIDVFKRDDELTSSTMRELHRGVWKGLYHTPINEIDLYQSAGAALESWSETTFCGLLLMARPSSILCIGASDMIPSINFINTHSTQTKLHYLQDSVSPTFEFIENHFPLVNPLRRVQSITTGKFGVIAIHLTLLPNWEGIRRALQAAPIVVVQFNPHQRDLSAVMAELGRVCEDVDMSLALVSEYKLRGDHDDQSVASEHEPIVALCQNRLLPQLDLTLQHWQFVMGEVTGSMELHDAQSTCPVRVPQFLSQGDIDDIRELAMTGTFGKEVRSPADLHDTPWYVLHLQSNGQFKQKLPDLRSRLIHAVRQVDREQQWGLLSEIPLDEMRLRVVEYHSMSSGGTLADPKHYDQDSLITIDMMLAEPGKDFEGGQLCTDGQLNQFEKGDAIVFVSHKWHSVRPVTKGTRNVMVVEFWRGPERSCPHRCLTFDECSLETAHADVGPGSQISRLPFRLSCVDRDGGEGHVKLLWQPTAPCAEPVVVLGPSIAKDADAAAELEAAWDFFD